MFTIVIVKYTIFLGNWAGKSKFKATIGGFSLVGCNNVLGGKMSTATLWRQIFGGNSMSAATANFFWRQSFFGVKVEPTRWFRRLWQVSGEGSASCLLAAGTAPPSPSTGRSLCGATTPRASWGWGTRPRKTCTSPPGWTCLTRSETDGRILNLSVGLQRGLLVHRKKMTFVQKIAGSDRPVHRFMIHLSKLKGPLKFSSD